MNIGNAVIAASVAEESGEAVVVSSEQTPVAIAIRDALLSDSRLSGAQLEIKIEGERVVLTGIAQSQEQKFFALSIAGRFVGRSKVIDQIAAPISAWC